MTVLGEGALGASKAQGDPLDNWVKMADINKSNAMANLYGAGGAGGTTLKATQEIMKQNPDMSFVDAYSIAKSGLGQGITMNDGKVATLSGAPEAAGAMQYGKTTGGNQSDLLYKPQIAAAEETAKANANTAIGDNRAIPVIDQLTKYNSGTFDMPYADTAAMRMANRLSPFENTQTKQKNLELLKQARLDLAAPLAKQLGVNPTDRDFQASLERIFDTNSTKASRQAQIDALAERIKLRQKTNPQGQSASTNNTFNMKTQSGVGYRVVNP
jgi:hypothetical protein